MSQREKVLNEYKRYADLCTDIQNNLAEESSKIETIRKLNFQIAAKNHDAGFLNAKLIKVRNKLVKHRIQLAIISYLILFLVMFAWIVLIDNGNTATFSILLTILVPFIVSVLELLIFDKEVTVPYIKISEDEKTDEYRELEMETIIGRKDLNKLISRYQAFESNALISGFITPSDQIIGPTIETMGEFKYPFISAELRSIHDYLKKRQAENIYEASMLYSQRINFKSSSEPDPQILVNVAKAANYAR
ncbi:hypothetical protein [Companilactobacillus mishanensis]|uniref:DUF2207 domain-containing protein n=1 Tax=Companilactobacillus mishanensis TaxID=2486008 RepID=A0ABW9P6C0_9LACO|nr:hypothetical protein [Companilactobacillus mishanensis]MQS44740.1 hypothetical protein [Companilactobacillus mishanensis]